MNVDSHQNAFGGRALPRPAGEAHSAPQDPLAGFKGPTSNGKGQGNELNFLTDFGKKKPLDPFTAEHL